MNVCEHGDHEAPDGKRFCSLPCERCESAPSAVGQDCAGVCLRPIEKCSCDESQHLRRALEALAVTVWSDDCGTVRRQRCCEYCGLREAQAKRGGKHEPFCPTGIALAALEGAP